MAPFRNIDITDIVDMIESIESAQPTQPTATVTAEADKWQRDIMQTYGEIDNLDKQIEVLVEQRDRLVLKVEDMENVFRLMCVIESREEKGIY